MTSLHPPLLSLHPSAATLLPELVQEEGHQAVGPASRLALAGCWGRGGEGMEEFQVKRNDGSVGAAPLFLVVHSSLLHPKLLSNREAEGAWSWGGPHLELGAEWSAWRKVAVV